MLLIFAERKSRKYCMPPIKNQIDSVMEAFQTLQETYIEHFSQVFKTITTDNGSEFSSLSELEDLVATLVYYTHLYNIMRKRNR